MCRYGSHRADAPAGEGPAISAAQRREWRRWTVEAFGGADAGVLPVAHLTTLIADREPDAVARSTVRAALTGTVLPALDRAGVLEYDADRRLLIKYP